MCSDHQSSTTGLIDAASILRHSIHINSIRHPNSNSKYDYKLYAIVHTNAVPCSDILQKLGFTLLIRDTPVNTTDIRGSYLRKHIDHDGCCGADEYIKYYAYTIMDCPIVVHTDIDFMYKAPMDDLFDAMLLPADSVRGMEARRRVEVEYPEKEMPEDIRAFVTRDYHQVVPGRKAAFQAGFIVLKPDLEVFGHILEVIKEGNYVEGFSRENGWGGKGYGGVYGSMGVQGLTAYFYDEIRPNTTVELNGCRYNHMGADILYRNVPNFIKRYKDLHGKCRRGTEGCENCQTTDLALIKNIHFTNCRKPWSCVGEVSNKTDDLKASAAIDPRTADYNHCMEVIQLWHAMRTDLEVTLLQCTGKSAISDGQKGSYKQDVFMGHCDKNGADGYLPIAMAEEIFTPQISEKIWSLQ